MQQRALFIGSFLILAISMAFSAIRVSAYDVPRSSSQAPRTSQATDFPIVDPNYIYDQLFSMVTRFPHREAGYDTNLPAHINGHDEFADYWSQEMVRDLKGFGAQIRRDFFPIQGWRDRPAPIPAFNVEVSVPGALHPEQVVVIGCHYDGEAVSTQSANDDGSGCAIELGVARALGDYWRQHHVYPARTLRFVIFDAEEQGLYGSFHYLNDTMNGDIQHIVAMFNEEQNGIAYPLRYLGQLAHPLLPFYIEMSPLTKSDLYPHQDKLSMTQRETLIHFRALMQQAVSATFAQFQALGYRELTYHTSTRRDSAQPIFTPDQMSYIHQGDDELGGSDQVPFTLAGIPSATFVGNSTYYERNPPAWSYPFDQTQDTIQLMNTFAQGGSHKSHALMLALALPAMLTAWMLHQPDILGEIPTSSLASGTPIAAISDIGQTQAGKSLTVHAMDAYDPTGKIPSFSYAWDFGDGSGGHGQAMTHTYKATGHYTLTLVVTSSAGATRVHTTLNVVSRYLSYDNPYGSYHSTGSPRLNRQVLLPVPDDTLEDAVVNPATHVKGTPASSTHFLNPLLVWVIGLSLLCVISGGLAFVLVRKMRARSGS